MAEATGLRNNALPYPIYGVPFGITFPLLDADGDPVSPSSPDSEVSKNGDTFADCTNEATEIATSSGICYLLLTGTEMSADVVTVRIQSTGAKPTVMTLYPRKLVSLGTGTVGANAADGTTIQLDSSAVAIDDYYNGCVVVGTIDTVVEARIIGDYVGSTKVCTVAGPAFNTAPDNNDTYVVYQPEGRQVGQATVVGWVATAIPGVDTAGYPKVTIKDGTGTGEIDTSSGKVSITNGAITSSTFASGAITAAAIAADAIGASELASDAASEIGTAVWATAARTLTAATNITSTGGTTVPQTGDSYARLGAPAGASVSADVAAVKTDTGNILTKLLKYVQLIVRKDSAIATDNATELTAINANGGSGAGSFDNTTDSEQAIRDNMTTPPTAAAIADQVWEEALTDHSGTSGSTAEALNAAGSAGDPWNTALPGAYASGKAGYILGTNLDATVSSRASQTSVDTIDDFVDTEVAAIKAKTDNLPSDPADASDIAASFSTVNSKLDAIDDYVDTEIAAIKAKTDNLPSDPADASDIAASFSTVNSTLSTIAGYIDTEVAAIKAKTDNLPASPAATGDAMTLTSGERNSIADALLKRDWTSVTGEASRSVLNALRSLRNRVGISGGTVTVYKEDDTTSAWTAAATTDANADPITEVDPS